MTYIFAVHPVAGWSHAFWLEHKEQQEQGCAAAVLAPRRRQQQQPDVAFWCGWLSCCSGSGGSGGRSQHWRRQAAQAAAPRASQTAAWETEWQQQRRHQPEVGTCGGLMLVLQLLVLCMMVGDGQLHLLAVYCIAAVAGSWSWHAVLLLIVCSLSMMQVCRFSGVCALCTTCFLALMTMG